MTSKQKNQSGADFSNKKILVVGLGISGLSTVRYLSRVGADVAVSDLKSEMDLDPGILSEARQLGATVETGGHRDNTFLSADMVIVSPGVPHDTELLRKVAKKDIPITGELEFAARLIDTPMIAVTGTNGKSTVTAFLGAMLNNAGLDVFVGGNIGTPLIDYAKREEKADYVVVEVSSFQLDTVEAFRPYISIILNISPDHLERYADYDSYVRSKLKIFRNQGPGQYLILNDDDTILSSVEPSSGADILRYGLEKCECRHGFIEDGMARICLEGAENSCFSLDSFRLPGRHNLQNLLAVLLSAGILDIDPLVVQKTINDFRGLPNRLEWAGGFNGVSFYNDSKATNVDAAVHAVLSFDSPIILIAGGRHKGSDYFPLVNAAKKRVKKAVFLGESRERLAASFEGILPFSLAEDMDEAVSLAFASSGSGDVVLLAPACSSFDMFSDYLHRGDIFRSAVKVLSNG